MYKITYSHKALAGLDEVLNYIENQFGLRIAEEINSEILEAISRLQSQPHSGYRANENSERHRVKVIRKRTIILYSIIEDFNVHILDIFDARTDWKK